MVEGQLILLGWGSGVVTGDFVTGRQPPQWARYMERGDNWPCNLPEFKNWRKVTCDELRPVRAFRAIPRRPDQKIKCLWVLGGPEVEAAPGEPEDGSVIENGETLVLGVAARLNEWWLSGGKAH